jgi:hypothetical protein
MSAFDRKRTFYLHKKTRLAGSRVKVIWEEMLRANHCWS